MRKYDESIQKCDTHSENSKTEFFFFVCWICSHLLRFYSCFKAFWQTIPLPILMHVNLTDQRPRRIWSCTSTWTLSKQVTRLVFRHDTYRSYVDLLNLNLHRAYKPTSPAHPLRPPRKKTKTKMKARSFDSAFWTNSANFGKARLVRSFTIYINAFPWFLGGGEHSFFKAKKKRRVIRRKSHQHEY